MTESPYGALIASPDAVITDSQGNTWSVQNGQVVKNGIPDPSTANVIALAYQSTGYAVDANHILQLYGQVWQENASLLWWAATGTGWSPANGTTQAPVPPSADGTVIMPGDPTPILDRGGNIWTISNGLVVENGVVDYTTFNVIALEYKNGKIWQENANHLWWSYSQAADGSPVWTPGTVPVARTWIGGGHNDARNPNNWSPTGAPVPGDTLTMTSGTMNIRGNALAGDTLTIPNAYEPGAPSPVVPTVNLRNADVSISGGSLDINVHDKTSKLSLSGDSLSDTIQIDPGSTLILSANLNFANLNVSGGTIKFIGDNTIDTQNTVFNANLAGTGTINAGGSGYFTNVMEINGSVGSHLTVNLTLNQFARVDSTVNLQIDHPEAFHAAIDRSSFGFVAFMGLHATSGEILNGILKLFDGDTLVDATRFTNNHTTDATRFTNNHTTSDPLQLQQNSAGVILSDVNSQYIPPGGSGTVLPLTTQS